MELPIICLLLTMTVNGFVINRGGVLQYDGDMSEYYDDGKENELHHLQQRYEELKDQYEFEKFFNRIMRRGSKYLDGLKNSLKYFVVETEHCDEERTQNENSTLDSFISSSVNGTGLNDTLRRIEELQGMMESGGMRNTSQMTRRCQNLTQSREDIISLVDLAAYTAEMAQEARKYDADEEIMLIAKLAKLLSILADKAHFRPRPEDFVNLDFSEEPEQASVARIPMQVSRDYRDSLQRTISQETRDRMQQNLQNRNKRQSVQPLNWNASQNGAQNFDSNMNMTSDRREMTGAVQPLSSNASQNGGQNSDMNNRNMTNDTREKARIVKNYKKPFYSYKNYNMGDYLKYKEGRNVQDQDLRARALVERDDAIIRNSPPNEYAFRFGGSFIPGANQFAIAFGRILVEAERN